MMLEEKASYFELVSHLGNFCSNNHEIWIGN